MTTGVSDTGSAVPHITVAAVRDVELTPWAPDLSGVCEVLEGELTMWISVLWSSEDGTSANGVWRCLPSRIRLVHPYDETFVVIDGRMSFTPAGGKPLMLGPGDVIVIPRGSDNVIEVHETVTKVWTINSPEGLGL
jgi:uncharacterized cupin superfamily protein